MEYTPGLKGVYLYQWRIMVEANEAVREGIGLCGAPRGPPVYEQNSQITAAWGPVGARFT